jgi:hypothetical protein
MGMAQSFDEAHDVWFEKHLRKSFGDRRLQLERRTLNEEETGEEAAEKKFLRDVWWPVYESLDLLIPEFEIVDGLGRTRYLDHAIVRYPMLVDLEVDGYGTHQKDASRWSFADDRRRDAGMRILGWDVLRFAFSDVLQHSLACQEVLKRWMESVTPKASLEGRIQKVIQLSRYEAMFTLGDVMELLHISEHPARKLLRKLVGMKVILPYGSGEQRLRAYQRNEAFFRGREPRKVKF